MFKWVCLLVAVLALSAYGWMLNDARLQVREMAARLDRQVPPLLTEAARVTDRLDRNLPRLLSQSEQVVATVNDKLPKLLATAETAADDVAELSDSFLQYRGLMGVVHAAAQDRSLLSYGTSVLDWFDGQDAVVGRKGPGPKPALKRAVPARQWAKAARRDVPFLSVVSRSRAELVHGLARTHSAVPWYVQVGDEAPRLLGDWLLENHPQSKGVK